MKSQCHCFLGFKFQDSFQGSLLAPPRRKPNCIWRVIDWGFQVPVEVCFNSAVLSAEREGYFVEEHCLSEDGQAVAQHLKACIKKTGTYSHAAATVFESLARYLPDGS